MIRLLRPVCRARLRGARIRPAVAGRPRSAEHADHRHDAGRIVIKLRPTSRRKHAERLKQLARDHFYDNVPFHRVIGGFMAQTGDGQNKNGTGGSKYPDLPAEFSKVPFKRGVVGMARTGEPNSANASSSSCSPTASFLNGKYTVVGEVVSGMDVVDKLKKGEPVPNPDKMVRVQVAADVKQ